MYDAEKEENISIIWLQAIDEPTLALPVMKPEFVYETYDPVVEDELLKSLGDDIQDDNIRVYCALTVPQDITKMTINLKAPIIVDFDTMKGIQLIADTSEYQVRYPIYDILIEGGELICSHYQERKTKQSLLTMILRLL